MLSMCDYVLCVRMFVFHKRMFMLLTLAALLRCGRELGMM